MQVKKMLCTECGEVFDLDHPAPQDIHSTVWCPHCQEAVYVHLAILRYLEVHEPETFRAIKAVNLSNI